MPGQYSQDRMVQCRDCPAGTFSNDTQLSRCNNCPVGTSTNHATGQIRCSSCTPGNFANLQGSPACSPCPIGTATRVNRTVSCPNCDVGTYQPLTGQPKCLPCTIGSVAPEGSSECKLCGQGTYAYNDKCMDCNMWYTSNPGSLNCPSPSWRMSALIGGIVGFFVILFGVCVVRKQKRRLGYYAVQSVFKKPDVQ